jgi:hypothetical protein
MVDQGIVAHETAGRKGVVDRMDRHAMVADAKDVVLKAAADVGRMMALAIADRKAGVVTGKGVVRRVEAVAQVVRMVRRDRRIPSGSSIASMKIRMAL